jgi:RNA polymerase sigma-70 factor (ECF subfamily)
MTDAAAHPTPLSLLQQLNQADPEKSNNAWRRFVQFYTPLLLMWARRLEADVNEADDLVQDVFGVLVHELPKFQYNPAQRFRGWLLTILNHRWHDRVRRRLGQPGQVEAGKLETMTVPDNVEAFAEHEYQSYLVARALEIMQSELPEKDWQACHGYLVEGRPAAEVAAELGLSVNQIYLAKSRILRRVREELQGLFD